LKFKIIISPFYELLCIKTQNSDIDKLIQGCLQLYNFLSFMHSPKSLSLQE